MHQVLYLGRGFGCDIASAATRTPDWRGPGWYRFTGAAGSRMPEQPPGTFHCGANTPGWLNGKHPVVPGQQVQITVCFQDSLGACGSGSWSSIATVLNCGEYFLYRLQNVPACGAVYCGSGPS